MPEPLSIPRIYYLLDTSRSMDYTYGIKWPLCSIIPGLTRGEHALNMCATFERIKPSYIHRYFISFQGDTDEYPDHSLSLDAIQNKYKNKSRPRYRSNIIQRLHNVLQIMKHDAQNRPNSGSRLIIFSDGDDNKSTRTLRYLHQQTMKELSSIGISVVVINYDTIGLEFPDARHFNSDDFPPGNMDGQVRNLLHQNAPHNRQYDSASISLSHSSRNNGQSNIRTLNDLQPSVEESQYQYNQVYVTAS
ncbi:unnamed protein product [Rotaria sp. Silwood2]|nr:unnamed protein product [Rotaria sp. Silwood2]CAF3263870.1 unnamed protein product [Rotaria sp. Silwood2]CAF4346164.1 unnamed protein product [Rotaria sp. Silwood2]CAF4583560.1 unnamed protein product [Rotaria sp. Silwood2]CAF4714956.1 unnamed protein product [Rotaria sp. Silwood2]